jgi:hypothetical protein
LQRPYAYIDDHATAPMTERLRAILNARTDVLAA